MNSKYKIVKFRENKFENVDDFISIEEPLEISIRFKQQDKWIKNSLSITMRTPGHDEDLVRGFLFNEQIIQGLNDIETIESFGEKVGQYNIQNKILVTLNNSKNVNISKIKRDFLTNSSCGVCGKSSLDALEILKMLQENEQITSNDIVAKLVDNGLSYDYASKVKNKIIESLNEKFEFITGSNEAFINISKSSQDKRIQILSLIKT